MTLIRGNHPAFSPAFYPPPRRFSPAKPPRFLPVGFPAPRFPAVPAFYPYPNFQHRISFLLQSLGLQQRHLAARMVQLHTIISYNNIPGTY